MGLNITIKEDGSAKNFTGVSKVVIPGISSGDTEWVPEAMANMKVKKITKNGTYLASSDNAAGYAAVFVSVPATEVTGKDPSDGNTYKVMVDGFGNIIKIPVT